jgi:hypothetical protein
MKPLDRCDHGLRAQPALIGTVGGEPVGPQEPTSRRIAADETFAIFGTLGRTLCSDRLKGAVDDLSQCSNPAAAC